MKLYKLIDHKEIVAQITKVVFKNIPDELEKRDAWVLWKPDLSELETKGKIGKKPINPKTYGYAKAGVPDTWNSYEYTKSRLKPGYGMGYELSGDDGITGVDIDKCIVDGTIEPWGQYYVDKLNSYTEISPSGTGLRIFIFANLPPGGNRKGKIELYDKGRFLTITGNHLEGTPLTIEPRQDELNQLHREIFGEPEVIQKIDTPISTTLTDDAIIEKSKKFRNGGKFTRLFDGNWQHDYSSQSQADQALCSMLAFSTRNNPAQIDNIFRRSGLYRAKWDEKHGAETYGQITINKAIRGNTAIYEPQQHISQRENMPATIKTFPLTDLGNSERLINRYGDIIRYCHELKKWFIWNGKQWKEDNQGRIFHLATLTIRVMVDESKDLPDADRIALIKWSLKSESRDKIKGMVDLAQNNPSIIISQGNFDCNQWLLNCQNGTINLKTGKLQNHRKEDYISKIMPISYDSAATCPIWEDTISKIMGGKVDLIEYLHKALGYSITGSVKEQDIFIPYGTGANGKSTFTKIIMDLLGPDYAKQTTATALLVKQNETVGEDVAVLVGARFVATIEVDDGKRLAESLVKQLTGGDKIRARFLYSNSFEFEPTFKLWLITNHKPKVTGTDQGIWRRLKLIPFTITIPEEKQDKDLLEKLKTELPGILNWCINGCLKWQHEGLQPPQEVIAATDSYKAEMDFINMFIKDCCKTEPDLKSSVKELHECYIKWCEGAGERPLGKRSFGSRLREKGYSTAPGTHNYPYWQGIGVVTTEYEQQDQWNGMGKIVDLHQRE